MCKAVCPECGQAAHSADTSPHAWICPSCGGNIPSPATATNTEAAILQTLSELILKAVGFYPSHIEIDDVEAMEQAAIIASDYIKKEVSENGRT
jgi:hypothetical protein